MLIHARAKEETLREIAVAENEVAELGAKLNTYKTEIYNLEYLSIHLRNSEI